MHSLKNMFIMKFTYVYWGTFIECRQVVRKKNASCNYSLQRQVF